MYSRSYSTIYRPDNFSGCGMRYGRLEIDSRKTIRVSISLSLKWSSFNNGDVLDMGDHSSFQGVAWDVPSSGYTC